MALSERHRRRLRQLGHALKPVVIVGGQGLHDALLAEVDAALEHHELIKVRVNAGDRAERDAMIATLCSACAAERIQRVGHVALLYRPHPERPRVRLD
ncbi:MAG: ribosome assembly RNA-binding protein YhbY [Gammaproteobacteria bacterium]|nr:ribosome assembly RNA-binding protein YhbY [Gammaproteobacteria bacterium]